MGLYDTFRGEVKCPLCGKQITFAVQTKSYNCILESFEIGDYIDTANKTCIHSLATDCCNCHKIIDIYVVVINGQLVDYCTDPHLANEKITKREHELRCNIAVNFLDDIERSLPPDCELLIRTNHDADGTSGASKECGKWFVHLESYTGDKNNGNVGYESVYKGYGDNLYEMLQEVERYIKKRRGE